MTDYLLQLHNVFDVIEKANTHITSIRDSADELWGVILDATSEVTRIAQLKDDLFNDIIRAHNIHCLEDFLKLHILEIYDIAKKFIKHDLEYKHTHHRLSLRFGKVDYDIKFETEIGEFKITPENIMHCVVKCNKTDKIIKMSKDGTHKYVTQFI